MEFKLILFSMEKVAVFAALEIFVFVKVMIFW